LYGTAVGQKLWHEPEALPAALSAPAAAPAVPKAPNHADASVYHLEAWMPEQIAVVKLRGFLKDIGGEVMESVPGLIRVRLQRCRRALPPVASSGLWTWIGLGKKVGPVPEFDPVDMEVAMEKPARDGGGRLLITVRIRPVGECLREAGENWRSWCDQIQGDLSAYLMAKRN
jgi:serine/threonine-protein kinase